MLLYNSPCIFDCVRRLIIDIPVSINLSSIYITKKVCLFLCSLCIWSLWEPAQPNVVWHTFSFRRWSGAIPISKIIYFLHKKWFSFCPTNQIAEFISIGEFISDIPWSNRRHSTTGSRGCWLQMFVHSSLNPIDCSEINRNRVFVIVDLPRWPEEAYQE